MYFSSSHGFESLQSYTQSFQVTTIGTRVYVKATFSRLCPTLTVSWLICSCSYVCKNLLYSNNLFSLTFTGTVFCLIFEEQETFCLTLPILAPLSSPSRFLSTSSSYKIWWFCIYLFAFNFQLQNVSNISMTIIIYNRKILNNSKS